MKKFNNYMKNLQVLKKAENEDLDNEFIISGIIDKFFIQFELGWKVLKETLRYEGYKIANTGSPREVIKAAYTVYYKFIDEDVWIEMLKTRNDMTHIYDGEAAKRFVRQILNDFIPEFEKMENGLIKIYGENLERIN